jgi:hypothetical protein
MPVVKSQTFAEIRPQVGDVLRYVANHPMRDTVLQVPCQKYVAVIDERKKAMLAIEHFPSGTRFFEAGNRYGNSKDQWEIVSRAAHPKEQPECPW